VGLLGTPTHVLLCFWLSIWILLPCTIKGGLFGPLLTTPKLSTLTRVVLSDRNPMNTTNLGGRRHHHCEEHNSTQVAQGDSKR
jgi:hypothetical protein